MNFSEWKNEDRTRALEERVNTTIILKKETVGFEKLEAEAPDLDVSKPFEMPPIIINKHQLSEIMVWSGDDEKGRWIRTLVIAYWNGGRILYRKLDDNNYEAQLIFNR